MPDAYTNPAQLKVNFHLCEYHTQAYVGGLRQDMGSDGVVWLDSALVEGQCDYVDPTSKRRCEGAPVSEIRVNVSIRYDTGAYDVGL